MRNNLKGQWFLISAVIASGAFLAISILFNNYFIVDTSTPALIDGDYYFNSVKNGINKTIAFSACVNLTRNLDNFVQFNKRELAEVGYFLEIKYTQGVCSASSKGINYAILLTSEKYVRCDKTDSVAPSLQLSANGINC